MRNLFLMLLFAFTLNACAPDTPATAPRAQTTAGNDLASKPAFACYGIIAGLVIGLLWSRIRVAKNKKPDKPGRQTPNPGLSGQTQLEDRELEYKNMQLEEELKKCRYQNETFKRELDEALKFSLTEAAQTIKPKPEKDNSAVNQEEYEQETRNQETTTLYYLQPAADGRFREMSKVHSAADALYEISYQNNNPGEASLKFIDSPGNAFLAIQNEPTWILVACERSNIPSDHTHSVRTDIPGKAVWKNGEWEILEKAKITYI